MLTIVGGVYREYCTRPRWDTFYGSAGRAASALACFQTEVVLHTYLDEQSFVSVDSRAALENFQLESTSVPELVTFYYHHGLASPRFRIPSTDYPQLTIKEEKVVRFGLIKGDAKVHSKYAVYDPQNSSKPGSFSSNGSHAEHLAVILNRYEAGLLSGQPEATPEVQAKVLAHQEKAEVVVIKMGPMGAVVYENGSIDTVSSYQTNNVWKIGSGDAFVAYFSFYWMEKRFPALQAADCASKATAYYCEKRGFPKQNQLHTYNPNPIQPSQRFKEGHKPLVYLAGPFFTLAQLWLIEQARENLIDMGLKVFSPYHDVGLGTADDVVQKDLDGINECDLMFAVGDGLDSGTIYEIGYACALNKPVIIYAENESEENMKMMEGSNCILCKDYVTAIYLTLWTASQL